MEFHARCGARVQERGQILSRFSCVIAARDSLKFFLSIFIACALDHAKAEDNDVSRGGAHDPASALCRSRLRRKARAAGSVIMRRLPSLKLRRSPDAIAAKVRRRLYPVTAQN